MDSIRKNTGFGHWLVFAGLIASTFAVHATVFSVDLGTGAPPATLGGIPVTPFNTAPQNVIVDGAAVSSVPAPFGGSLKFSPVSKKYSVPDTWFTWSHGFTGAVFGFDGTDTGTSATFTLPPSSQAFYFYYEGNQLDVSTVTVTTDKGVVLGPISVTGAFGATGIGFYSDDPTESIASLLISSDDSRIGVAEFGMASSSLSGAVPVPTLSQWALVLMTALLAVASALLSRRRSALFVRNRRR